MCIILQDSNEVSTIMPLYRLKKKKKVSLESLTGIPKIIQLIHISV